MKTVFVGDFSCVVFKKIDGKKIGTWMGVVCMI